MPKMPKMSFPAGVMVFTALLAGAFGGPARGQLPPMANAIVPAPPLLPDAEVDPAIPTPEQVLGHSFGEWIVSFSELRRYFDALAAAAPDRVRLETYGTTWEGRELFYLSIGTAERIAALDAMSENYARLADPRTTDGRAAEQLIGSLPAAVWLAYGVHGNEISSPDAAMATAYYLLAAPSYEPVREILENTVVFLDPSQNPDGRDRFVAAFRAAYGLEPDPARFAAQRDEPWPGGRTNHYLFDLNRDWIAATQPETRGRIRLLRKYLPLVFVDLHEMGSDSSYYFAPEAVPYNPHLAQDQRDNLELFGLNNARWFDGLGFDYFTREVYDAFYPGYGASWPSYYGAIAMTYEMASARGLRVHRSDGRLLTFRDGVQRHLVTSLSTAQTAARHRVQLLQDFRAYRESAIEEGSREPGRTLLLSSPDPTAVDKLAGLLAFQGVEIDRLTRASMVCGSEAAAGSYLVDLAQPAKRLLRTLLDVNVPMDDEFLSEQERRRDRNLRDQIYDVTAWSLPLQFGVEMTRCDGAAGVNEGARERVVTPDNEEPPLHRPGRLVPQAGEGPTMGYILRWGEIGAVRLLAGALRQGLVALSPDRPFTVAGVDYPAGSMLFKTSDNPGDLAARLERLVESTGATVQATPTSWVSEGVNFGSRQSVLVQAPRIAMLWDEPTSSYSAGNGRFVIERQIGYPVTALRGRSLARAELERFDVLLLPDGRGGYDLPQRAADEVASWVRSGGTLIAIGSSIDWVAEAGLSDLVAEKLASELAPSEPSPEQSPASGVLIDSEEEYLEAIRAHEPPPDSLAGVLARADVDLEHWLAAGLPQQVTLLVSGRGIYRPLKVDSGVNVLRFSSADSLLASGYAWEENRRQLAYKPAVTAENRGRGLVLSVVADPLPRAYQDGLVVLLGNLLFRAPAHASPVR